MESTYNFSFSWPILKVVLEGLCILDVKKLEINSMEEATNFIHAYGYDTSDPSDTALLWGYFNEAVDFIDKALADPQYNRVPDHLRSEESVKDIRRLLLLASEGAESPDQPWACAILRIMHVLIHISHDPRMRFFEQVQNQVLHRLDNYLYVDDSDGAIYLGRADGQGRIKILFFKKKDRKDKIREIIKLLHKVDAVAEEIYDRIGFRLVTETKFDAIRAVRLLLNESIISLPNIRPRRSRNWLIDLPRLQSEIEKIEVQMKKEKKFDLEKAVHRLERKISYRRATKSLINPYSSSYYHAIQFTCRELIKIKNPHFQTYSRIKTQLEKVSGGQQILAEVYPRPIAEFDHVFFPYEIQIMDVKSYADSIFGKSNHEEYRRKQLEAARNRVFGRTVKN